MDLGREEGGFESPPLPGPRLVSFSAPDGKIMAEVSVASPAPPGWAGPVLWS